MDSFGAKFKSSQVNTGQVRPGDEPSQSQVGASESKEEPKEVPTRSFLWKPSLKGYVLSDYRVNPPELT